MTYFDSHRDNVLWFWSIAAAGGIPTILSSLAHDLKTREAQIANVESIFDEPILLTSQHLACNVNPTTRMQIVTTSDISRPSDSKNGALQVENSNTRSGDLAAILFTSGSTGFSKAVEFSHAQLIASVAEKKAFHGTDSETNFLSWTSFDHSANFCEIHLNALNSSSNQVHVATTDLASQPTQFFHLLSLYQIGYTFLPNAFLAAATKAFSAQDYRAVFDLSRLSVIMCGGEANKTSTIMAADSLLVRLGAKEGTIKSSYGLSETCSACFYNTESPLYDLQQDYTFASVGKHLPGGLELRVLEENGRDQIPCVRGAIQLRGDVVFKRYHNNDIATKACMTTDNWFDTGDVGFLDLSGNLRVVGRSKEIIIINGNNYSSFELEYAIESSGVSGVTPSHLATFSSWDDSGNSEGVVVLFNPDEKANSTSTISKTIDEINKAILGFCAKQPLAIIPLPKEQMPKSTIGKLSRRKLKEQFEAGTFAQYRAHSNGPSTNGALIEVESSPVHGDYVLSAMEKEIVEIFSRHTKTPPEAISSPDALGHLGIDSIGYMQIRKSLQNAFRFDQDIPMAMLIGCSSVHELEQTLLTLGTVYWEYDPIVPLSVRGSKNPLFLIHPGNGEFLNFVQLKPFLVDRPVYALRARGLHLGEGEFEGLDALINSYFDAIKKTQVHGPYAILGYCFGGMVAFELAKRLEAGGEEVAFIGGIDNPPDLASILGKPRHREVLIDMLSGITSLTKEEAQAFSAKTEQLSDEDFYEDLFGLINNDIVDSMLLTASRIQAYARVEDSIRDMTAPYRPTGSVSKWDCFRASPSPHFNASDTEWRTERLVAWDGFCRSQVRYHDLEGDHLLCVRGPCLDRFQTEVNRALTARGI